MLDMSDLFQVMTSLPYSRYTIQYNTIQYLFIVWLADRNHIKAQKSKHMEKNV